MIMLFILLFQKFLNGILECQVRLSMRLVWHYFKDVFWSSSFEHDIPYLSFPKKVLPNREIFIVTLSTGPVSLDNGINYTIVERSM